MISNTAVPMTKADADSPAIRLLLLQGLALLVVGALTLIDTHIFWNPIRFREGDVWHYYRTATQIMLGHLPYRDFPLEYPPLSVVPFLVPLLLAGGHTVSFSLYGWLLLTENIALSLLFTLTLASTAKSLLPERRFALTRSVFLIAVLSPLLPWRYDLFPAILTLLALRSVLQKRPFPAGIWLGLGIAAKLYPIVFLPVLAGYYWVQKDSRANIRLLGGCAFAIILSLLPFAAAGLHILSFLRYHEQRGIEIGSFSAGTIFLAHFLWRMPVMIIFNYGAFHLFSPISRFLLALTPWTTVTLLSATALVSLLQMRKEAAQTGQVRTETLIGSLTAILVAFIVTNKVFSPQYMIWLLPFVPLLPSRLVRPFTAAFVLTIVLFPFAFDSLLMGQPWAIGLLVSRNLLMVWLLGKVILSRRQVPLSPQSIDLPIINGRKALGEQP